MSGSISRVLFLLRKSKKMTIIHLGHISLCSSSNLPENKCEPHSARRRVFLFGLAPDGVYLAAACCQLRGELLPHRFTLTCSSENVIGGLFSVALSVGSHRPAVNWHPALWCPDFPPSANALRDCPTHSVANIKAISGYCPAKLTRTSKQRA